MSNLLKKYETSDHITVSEARRQAEGTVGVNHFDTDSEFQEGFVPRKPGNTSVLINSDDDSTNGNLTSRALSFYQEQISKLGGLFHKRSQRDKKTHYLEENKTTLGVANRARPE